ncbi:MAG: M28 family peptidase [Bryobacteraceae bacterium]|nr:M28 family peptidase [Bryobacteraceae bacterium]MDW8376932.1 M28 family peptidase [Bryobacterales bacterium]
MRCVFYFALGITAVISGLEAQPPAPQIESIRRDQLKADVFFLAGDFFRGRLTGTPEYRIAAEYLASRFERLGLKPLAQDGFFHRFDLVLSRLGRDSDNRITLNAAGRSKAGKLLEDFYPLIFSADGEAEGRLVFAGYGIVAPKLGWNDYSESIKDDIVVVLEGEPGADDPKSPFDGLVTSEYANAISKTLEAQSRGASAIVFVNPSHRGKGTRAFPASARAYWPEKPPHLERYTLASRAERVRIPVLQLDPVWVEQAFGKTAGELKQRAEKPGAFIRSENQSLRVAVALNRFIVEDRSVVGLLEGGDAQQRQEAVFVTAHYDHNGATAEQIFPGADDNASGSAAVIEIAEAFVLAAQSGQRPKRSVIFAIWGSEERCCGPLLGSWAWVENPDWPLEKTVAVLNMDMIGRNEEVPETGGSKFNGLKPQTAQSNAGSVNLLGWSYSPELSRMADAANRKIDLRLLRRYDNNRSNLLRRSDQWPFLQRGVPSLFVHTGLHPDYHTPYDRPERIDYSKMERITRFVYQLSWDLANADGRPRFLSPRTILPPEAE